jgi:hypothetical protein
MVLVLVAASGAPSAALAQQPGADEVRQKIAVAAEEKTPAAPKQEPPADEQRDQVAPAGEKLAANAPAPGASVTAETSTPNLASPGVTEEDVQGIRSDLENFKFQWQRERDLHTGITTRPLLIGGLVQARAGGQDKGVTGAGVADRKVTFDLGAAQLIFAGNLYKDYQEGRNLSYMLRLGASAQAGTNNSFVNLIDANITYSLVQALSPEDYQLTVTMGQQPLPFGLEVAASDELKPVINNAQFATRLGLARRELGVFVKGDIVPRMDYGYNYRQALISYALGAVSGNGPNTPDDNSWKDLVARLAFTLPSDYHSVLRQLTLGGTAYFGKQNRMLPAAKDASRAVLGLGRKRRLGGDLYYSHHPIGITYEYIYAEDGLVDPTSTFGEPKFLIRKADSHVITLFYNFGEQFLRGYRAQGRFDDWWPKSYQPFFRYDTYDPDTSAANDRSDVYTLGFNVFFAETTKFQVNYNYKYDRATEAQLEANPTMVALLPKVHELLAQFQFGF